jgi:protein TonB
MVMRQPEPAHAAVQPELDLAAYVADVANVPPVPALVQPPTVALPMPASAPAGAATPAPAALPHIELPSSDAEHLHNPQPVYPALSQRLGESGHVILRVFIQADGSPKDIQVHQSSGFARLDQAAMTAVATWRFVPGKESGQPKGMWFKVPLHFALKR